MTQAVSTNTGASRMRHLAIGGGLTILLCALDTLPLFRLALSYEERVRTRSVTGEIPSLFPVLVVSGVRAGRPEARIVFYEHLHGYLGSHPDHQFTVPPDQVAELNRQLATQQQGILTDYDNTQPQFGAGRFEVTQLGKGRQRFKVEGTWDDDRVNIGWYEADARSFWPLKRVWYFGPGLVLKYLPLIVLLNTGVSAVAAALYGARVDRRHRSKAALPRDGGDRD